MSVRWRSWASHIAARRSESKSVRKLSTANPLASRPRVVSLTGGPGARMLQGSQSFCVSHRLGCAAANLPWSVSTKYRLHVVIAGLHPSPPRPPAAPARREEHPVRARRREGCGFSAGGGGAAGVWRKARKYDVEPVLRG